MLAIAAIYLRAQSFWFGARSKPGLQSQATPPLGVSRQMWAQPWSLFMQLRPSGERQTGEVGAGREGERTFQVETSQPADLTITWRVLRLLCAHVPHTRTVCTQPPSGGPWNKPRTWSQVWGQASL